MHKPEKYHWRDWSGGDCPFTDHQASALVQFRSGIVQDVKASNCRWFHADWATLEWGLKANHFVPSHDIIRYVPLGAALDWEVAKGAIIRGREIVDALLRDGTLVSNMFAMSLRWTSEGGPGDVVAFRRHTPMKAEAPQAAAPAEIKTMYEFDTDAYGRIRLEQRPGAAGYVLWVGGSIVWESWANDRDALKEAIEARDQVERQRQSLATENERLEAGIKGRDRSIQSLLNHQKATDINLRNAEELIESGGKIITELNEKLRLKHDEATSLTGNLNEVLKAHNERARERDTARELLETAESTIRAQAVQIGACQSQASAMIENEKGHVHSVKAARMVIKRLVEERTLDRAGRPSVEAWRAAHDLLKDWG